MSNAVKVVLATASVVALAACTVNTAPPASAPSVVVAPPTPTVTPGSTVIIPR